MKTWLFLSGLGSSYDWSTLLLETAGHTDVVVLKVPGMTQGLPLQWREEGLLKALEAQISALEGPLVLVGHSYGARLACILAERNPRIASVVFLAPVLTPRAFLRACGIFCRFALQGGWLGRQANHVFFTEAEFAHVRQLAVGTFGWRGLLSQLWVAVPRLLSPTRPCPRLKLVIWGGQDAVVSPQPVEGAACHILPEGGHYWWVASKEVWDTVKAATT